jgi:hypothetical protein
LRWGDVYAEMKLAVLNRKEHLAFYFRIEKDGAEKVGMGQSVLDGAAIGGIQFPVSTAKHMEIKPEYRAFTLKPLVDRFRGYEISYMKRHTGFKSE